LPLWTTLPGGDEQVVTDLMEGIGRVADEMVRDIVPDSAVIRLSGGEEVIDEAALNGKVKTSMLGLSVGGVLAINTLIDNSTRYHRVFALSARTSEAGLKDLEKINPPGATTVSLFHRNRGRLSQLGLTGRVATGLRENGDSRVSPEDCILAEVEHFPFRGVSGDHFEATGQMATTQPFVTEIANFLRAA
jgi:hypothetical protein